MATQFYRKQNDKNLYELGSNRVIGATEFGKGAGFQEVKMPQGAVAINGAQYKDKASQQANFANITPIGSTLYGVPKTPTSSDLKAGITNAGIVPPQPTAPTVQSVLADRAGEMSQGANDTIKMLQAQQPEAEKRVKEQEAKLAELQKQETGITSEYDKLSTPFRDELQKANNDKFEMERQIKQSISLADDLQNYSKLMNDELMAEANQPGLARVRQGSMQNVKDTYTSKIATAQAAMAAIKGNIGLVNEYTDRGIAAIEADRNDRISYLSFVSKMLESDQVSLLSDIASSKSEIKKSIESQINTYKTEIEKINKNKEVIAGLMSSPETAIVAHNAGVLLTDTQEQMVEKMSNYLVNNPEQLVATENKLSTQVVKVNGQTLLINKNTGEVIKNYNTGATGGAAVQVSPSGNGVSQPAQNKQELSARAKAVYDNPSVLKSYTPTEQGKILDELAGKGYDISKFASTELKSAARETISQYDTMLSGASQALGMINSGKIDTGPLASKVAKAKALVGGAKDFTLYRSLLDNMSSLLVKLRSGAAVTPQEFERIKGFIPSVNDDEKTAKTKIESFISQTNEARDTYIKNQTATTSQLMNSTGETRTTKDGTFRKVDGGWLKVK